MDLQAWGALIPVAQYVRMSTDDQKYSPHNQSATNEAYAAAHRMMITRTYFDGGKSGLTFDGRGGLNHLIKDVLNGEVDFKAILVLDVSRWGRFQDPDESAYYEYSCKRAGIAVHYCAELFENDGSPLGAMAKWLKRSMAGEYSRDLSAKTFAGQARMVRLGFRLGGNPGYACRRLVVDQNGNRKFLLKPGEQKGIRTDRIVLVPGPAREVETVRWIFATFVKKRKSEFQIASILNQRGLLNDYGRPWNRHAIQFILRNEKYVGNNVWNRESFKLQKVRVRNRPETWLRSDGAFTPIVDRVLFDAAQSIFIDRLVHPIVGRGRIYSDMDMLRALRRLLRQKGYLTKKLIDKSGSIQSASAYTGRFGSLSQAYRLIRYSPQRTRRRVRPNKRPRLSDAEMLEKLRSLLVERGYLDRTLIDETISMPAHTTYVIRFGGLKRAYEQIGYMPDLYKKRSSRPRDLSSDEMLNALRRLLQEKGSLSQETVGDDKTVPAYYQYRKRFGGLGRAYRIIGYVPKH
jgi:DNA invertase Pin-like site-specific DNA recombinase